MKIITIFLTFLGFFCFSQELKEYSLVYTSRYESSTVNKNVTLVTVVTKDSVRCYIDEVGYIWWKIIEGKHVNYPEKKIIDTGQYELTYKDHRMLIVISNKYVYQTVLLKGEPSIIIHIKLIRNKKIEEYETEQL